MDNLAYLKEILTHKILLLDGAMGTEIQNRNLSPTDFGGDEYYGCNEKLNVTRPDIIEGIHRNFLEAGADIISTNSFGSTSLVLSEYGLAEEAALLSTKAAQIASCAAASFSSATKPRFVAGSVGPTTSMINVTGNIGFDQLKEQFKRQISALIEGGVHLILFETFSDTSNLKAGIMALKEISVDRGLADFPFMISVTLEQGGKMLCGQEIDTLYHSLQHFSPLSVGINCGLGVDQLKSCLQTLSELSQYAVSFHPNAGLPDEEGRYGETAAEFGTKLSAIVKKGQVNIVGGCCGTTAEHISYLSELIKKSSPREVPLQHKGCYLSGRELLKLAGAAGPVMVGERTNMSGSKKFRRLIREHRYEQAAEIARQQVLQGAGIIDINLSDSDTEERENVRNFYPLVLKKIKTPVMIDSSGDPDCIEEALKFCQGKCIINSVNLENRLRLQQVAALADSYGAALVALLIDENEMAVSLERKVEVADRLYKILTEEEGIRGEDIIFDCLVFPLGSGDNSYYLSGRNTIESIRILKKKYPLCRFSLGISNCSFGFPPAGREALNSAYLHHASLAGLDLAIVNSAKIVRYASLATEEKQLCEGLIFDNTVEQVKRFSAFYGGRKARGSAIVDTAPYLSEQRLEYHVVEGLKSGLEKEIDEMLKKESPYQVLNRKLIPAMAEVGRSFNAHELTVVDVLQSAEVMKVAVDYLKRFMDDSKAVTKGKFLLATVKGDVHDIGKNLVKIILANNGYEVIDLGIKIGSAEIIEAVEKYQPDALGLSGLLVQSALQMRETAQALAAAGITIPLLVGGAALSEKFVASKIQPHYGGKVLYAGDAVAGLNLLNDLLTKTQPDDGIIEDIICTDHLDEEQEKGEDVKTARNIRGISPRSLTLADPLNFKLNVISSPSSENIFKQINKQMLYGKHLGLKGGYDKLLRQGDKKAVEITSRIEELQRLIIEKEILKPKAVYRFFRAEVNENDEVILFEPEGRRELERFRFPRQQKGKRLSISDFIGRNGGDTVGMFCVTAGEGVAALAEAYRIKGEFMNSHLIHVLAITVAETLADIVHRTMRREWGLEVKESEKKIGKSTPKSYRGCRYSFGYSACPDLGDQKKLFRLLEVTESIGVQLSEGMMMEPEASVSALVVHHPEARLFNC